jgi:hypothetical protein
MKLERLTKLDYLKLMGNKRTPRMNQNQVILVVSDFNCPHEEISKKLSLQPTRVRLKGEEYRIGGIGAKQIAKQNIWEHKIETVTNENLSDQVMLFVRRTLKPRLRPLKTISKKAKISLDIVQYHCTGHNPEFELTREAVKLLLQLNARIWLDVYCLSIDK